MGGNASLGRSGGQAAALALCGLVLLAACGEERDDEPVAPRAVPGASLGSGEAVSYVTSDSVRISATVRVPAAAEGGRALPAVVFVHQLGGDRSDFNLLASERVRDEILRWLRERLR